MTAIRLVPSSGYPYFIVAKTLGLPYWVVLCLYDRNVAKYWHNAAWDYVHKFDQSFRDLLDKMIDQATSP